MLLNKWNFNFNIFYAIFTAALLNVEAVVGKEK